MRTWAEIESDPAFHASPDAVKSEVRGFYKAHLSSRPEFFRLSQDQRAKVLARIDGDADFPVKMAAALIVAAQKETLGRSMIDPERDDLVSAVVSSAKLAEHYLDVPLGSRPHEPLQAEIPAHLDKPLRALLGFMDDATPEYAAAKIWITRSELSLESKMRDILTMASRLPTQPINAASLLQVDSLIHTQEDLNKRVPPDLPPIQTWPVDTRNGFIAKDPEAALKAGFPKKEWPRFDLPIIRNIAGLLSGLARGLPMGLRPDAVAAVVDDVRRDSYELMARAVYGASNGVERLSVEPDRISATILAADVLAPGMSKVADDFPCLFAVVSGLAASPKLSASMMSRLPREFQPVSVTAMFQSVRDGRASFIHLSAIEESMLDDAAKSSGARPEVLARVIAAAKTAAKTPLMSAIVVKSEMLDRRDFEAKKQEIRQKVGAEAKRQMEQPAPEPAPVEVGEPPAPEPEPEELALPPMEPMEDFEEKMARLMGIEDESPGEPAPPPPPPQEAPEEHVEASDTPAAAPTQPEPAKEPFRPILKYLQTHTISVKSAKKHGLSREFKAFPGVLAADGEDLDAVMTALVVEKLLPKGADYNDLLDALEAEKITPAFKDPKTGKVTTGRNHKTIAEGIKDPAAAKVAMAAHTEKNDDAGFVADGKFITRSEAKKRYGFSTSEELAEMSGAGK